MLKFVCKTPPKIKHDKKSDKFDKADKLKHARTRLLEVAATPASPSPPREFSPIKHAPIVIPTEKIAK